MPISFCRLCRTTLTFSLLAVSACAEVRTVWQIGIFDQSPLEFSRGEQNAEIAFDVKSDWKTVWPARQGINHPYRIAFSLDSLAGTYSLKIATLIERPRVPRLDISINGHPGTFYLRPSLSYHPGDFAYAFDPHESNADVQFDIPHHSSKPAKMLSPSPQSTIRHHKPTMT